MSLLRFPKSTILRPTCRCAHTVTARRLPTRRLLWGVAGATLTVSLALALRQHTILLDANVVPPIGTATEGPEFIGESLCPLKNNCLNTLRSRSSNWHPVSQSDQGCFQSSATYAFLSRSGGQNCLFPAYPSVLGRFLRRLEQPEAESECSQVNTTILKCVEGKVCSSNQQ